MRVRRSRRTIHLDGRSQIPRKLVSNIRHNTSLFNFCKASANAILAPQEDGEPIDIDDAYGPSTDDLNIGHDQPYSPLKLQLPQPNGYPSKPRENVTVAPDGAATSRLKRSLELINVDSDPIEQFESSDFVPSSNHVSVKERVAHIDQGGITPLTAERRVDFRTLPIKARMKKKDPQVRLARSS